MSKAGDKMTPRTKEQNDVIRRQRIYQIRNIAAEVFLEKGINLEIGDIAKKASLGRGTIYHYYNNKITLLEDLLNEAFKEAKKNTIETINTNEDPLIKLEQYARRQLKNWVEQPFVFILFKNFLFQSDAIPVKNSDEILKKFQAQLYNPVVKTIEEGIHSGQLISIDSDTVVRLFFGALVGTVHSYIKQNDGLDITVKTQWIDDVITILFKGLKAQTN
jgi:AcrR family transcriptional regulator